MEQIVSAHLLEAKKDLQSRRAVRNVVSANRVERSGWAEVSSMCYIMCKIKRQFHAHRSFKCSTLGLLKVQCVKCGLCVGKSLIYGPEIH